MENFKFDLQLFSLTPPATITKTVSRTGLTFNVRVENAVDENDATKIISNVYLNNELKGATSHTYASQEALTAGAAQFAADIDEKIMQVVYDNASVPSQSTFTAVFSINDVTPAPAQSGGDSGSGNEPASPSEPTEPTDDPQEPSGEPTEPTDDPQEPSGDPEQTEP